VSPMNGGPKKLERGLIVATDHSKITSSPTNNSPGKAAWSVPRGERFEWQINPAHTRISHTDSYMNSSFIKKKGSTETTFGTTKRDPFPGRKNPSPCAYQPDCGSTFKRSLSVQSI